MYVYKCHQVVTDAWRSQLRVFKASEKHRWVLLPFPCKVFLGVICPTTDPAQLSSSNETGLYQYNTLSLPPSFVMVSKLFVSCCGLSNFSRDKNYTLNIHTFRQGLVTLPTFWSFCIFTMASGLKSCKWPRPLWSLEQAWPEAYLVL